MKIENVWIEVFKTGWWNGGTEFDAKGKKLAKRVAFTIEHLDSMVANFEPGAPDIALKIGHVNCIGEPNPTGQEAEAAGWVNAMRREGDVLLIQPRDVSWSLKYGLNERRFCKPSIEFCVGWPTKDGQGMKPGLVMTGVAFLGATAPAVNGLAEATIPDEFDERLAYAAHEEGMKVFRFCADVAAPDKFEVETDEEGGEEDMTKEEIEAMCRNAAEAAVGAFKASPEFQALVANGQTVTAATTAAGAEQGKEGCVAFAARLLSEKRITPAEHDGLAEMFAALPAEAQGVVMAQYGKRPVASIFQAADMAEEGATQESSDVQKFAAKYRLDPAVVQAQVDAMAANGSASHTGVLVSVLDGK